MGNYEETPAGYVFSMNLTVANVHQTFSRAAQEHPVTDIRFYVDDGQTQATGHPYMIVDAIVPATEAQVSALDGLLECAVNRAKTPVVASDQATANRMARHLGLGQEVARTTVRIPGPI